MKSRLPGLTAKHMGDGNITLFLVVEAPSGSEEDATTIHQWTCSPAVAEALVRQLREAIESARRKPN